MTTQTATYDASSIKHLSGADALRAKPAMYIGPTDGGGIFTILRELLDNARDENLAGHCSLCEVFIDDDGSYWVLDNGRGMPVGNMQVTDAVSGKSYTMPALQAITGLLHAGGKLDSTNKAYATSVGSHGVGQKATNFLSDEFDVWTFSTSLKTTPKMWYHIGYRKGKLTSPMAKCKVPDHPFRNSKVKSGTLIRMKPDLTIFSEKSFPMRMIAEWAQIAAYFTDKLKIVFAHHSGKERTFYSPDGPTQYVADQILKLKATPIHPTVFTYRDELVDCVFQLTSADGCEVSAFTNGLANGDKGHHFNSLFVALMGALEPHVKRGQEFGQQELREGLVGLVNAKLSSPKFSSQTKEKLVDDRAGKPLQEILGTALKAFMAKNKALASMMCERASELRKLKSKFTASKQVLNKLKQVQRIGLPAKAAVSPHCKPENRELYLLEGESAASLARSALYPGFQELLPLKGKISNCFVKETLLLKSGKETDSIKNLNATWAGVGYDIGTSKVSTDKMSASFSSGFVTKTVSLTFEDGTSCECTPEQLFLTRNRGYVAAKDLSEEDDLVQAS